MNTKNTEILVGLFIAIGLASLFMLAMKVSNLNIYNDDSGYEITANFDDISGLKVKFFSENAISAIWQGSAGLLRKANSLAKGALIACISHSGGHLLKN